LIFSTVNAFLTDEIKEVLGEGELNELPDTSNKNYKPESIFDDLYLEGN